MIIDLTTNVTADNPLMVKARAQDDMPLAMGHIGTHLDRPEKTVIPLQYFKSRGVMFKVQGIDEIGISHIETDTVRKNDFVLFHTGHLEKYGYGEQDYFQNHPQLSKDLIQLLINYEINFIGLDAPGIRQGDEHGEADGLCERHGVYVIENLCNLNELPAGTGATIYTMWFDDENVTGLRCRVLAETMW